MNVKEIETFNDMKKMVNANSKILVRIDRVLNGDPDDRKDFGLAGDVRNNVRWKNSIQKVLGVLGFGIATLWLKDVWNYFKG